MKYKLVFDGTILNQLRKTGKNNHVRNIISKMFDKIEEKGPYAGKLIDSRLKIYEIKSKRPPIRLYFKHNIKSDEMYIFEYQMKTSEKKQNKIIEKIRGLLKFKFFSRVFFSF